MDVGGTAQCWEPDQTLEHGWATTSGAQLSSLGRWTTQIVRAEVHRLRLIIFVHRLRPSAGMQLGHGPVRTAASLVNYSSPPLGSTTLDTTRLRRGSATGLWSAARWCAPSLGQQAPTADCHIEAKTRLFLDVHADADADADACAERSTPSCGRVHGYGGAVAANALVFHYHVHVRNRILLLAVNE